MSARQDQSLTHSMRFVEDPIDDMMRLISEINTLQRELQEIAVKMQELVLDEMSMLVEIKAQQLKQ